jgi:hypothetical protein
MMAIYQNLCLKFILLTVTCRNAPSVHATGEPGFAHAHILVAGFVFTLPTQLNMASKILLLWLYCNISDSSLYYLL